MAFKATLVCILCGREFDINRPYRLKTAKFCSRRCQSMGVGKLNAEKIGNTKRYRGAGKGYVKYHGRHLHRVVAEQKLGRPLRPGEIVHHDDLNKRNNEPDNLKVTTQSKHINLHRRQLLAARGIVHD